MVWIDDHGICNERMKAEIKIQLPSAVVQNWDNIKDFMVNWKEKPELYFAIFNLGI